MIADVLNSENEGYSKLKQIVKESVKTTLSENKQVISLSFAALLQTLKSDPKMINIIYKILTANDSEQNKDEDNDKVTKYLESNKDRLLDLAEKNYENLIKALANKFIGTTTTLLLHPIPHYHCRSLHLHFQTYLIKVIPTE